MKRRSAVASRLLLVAALAVVAAALLSFGGGEFLNVAGIKNRVADLREFAATDTPTMIAIFIAVQALALMCCLPGAVLAPALASGALFGPWLGTAVSLAAVTIGDSLGFLVARYVLRNALAQRFERQIAKVGEGSGAAFLLSLRLMAVVPYFVVNIAMALTRIPWRLFAPVSFIGLIPATIVYANAGAHLSRIGSASDIWNGPLIAAFIAVGVLPLAARWAYRRYEERKT